MSTDLLNLPVWPIKPNWSNAVTERLEWLTNVLASSSGSEQRQSVRLSPRRSLEFTINPVKRERAFADLFLHRLTSQEVLIPLWHDKASTTSAIAIDDTFVPFDTQYREYVSDECALLFKDAFTWEVVMVDSVAVDGIHTANQVTTAWPAGTVVFPLRAAELSADSNFSALSGQVGEAQLLFTMSRSNDYTADSGMLSSTFGGYPILTTRPNRTDALDQAFQRIIQELDGKTGLRRSLDLPGRSFVTQIHNWTAYGREGHHDLRALLYRLRGRQKSLWVPTFNEDVVLAADHSSGSTVLTIEDTGYTYTGGAVAGRNRFWNPEVGVLTVAGIAAPPSSGKEYLTLSAPLTGGMPKLTSMSFVDIARMDQDTVEITHHADTDGLTEVSCAFRSFRNARSETPAVVHGVA